MSAPNPHISNGTCYYAENTVTKGDFIPCGNDAIQTWPCCQAGSYCLALGDANACWDAKSGNTYVAGCTDPSFGSPNCLHKPPQFHDQEWVAINQACKNLNANSATDGVTNWTGCVVDKNSTELVKLPMAACTPYCAPTDVLYAGISSLPAYASLPTLSGSSIFWQNNFVPPTTPAPGYTPGTPTGVVGTGHPGQGSGGSSGLSTGAKAGIGVGAAVGGIILLAMLTSLLIWRRKRRQQQLNPHGIDPNMPPPAGHPYNQPYPPTYPPSGGHPSPPNNYNIQAYHQSYGGPPPMGEFAAPNTPVAAYTGYKTELPADQSFPLKGQPSPGQEYIEMDNPSEPVPANYLQPHPQQAQQQERTSADGGMPSPGLTVSGGGGTPGSPPVSATSTMLAPVPTPSPGSGHLQMQQGGVYHSRSTSSPSYSARVTRQQQEAAGVYHSRSVSSSGVSPGYSASTATEGGWEAGSYR